MLITEQGKEKEGTQKLALLLNFATNEQFFRYQFLLFRWTFLHRISGRIQKNLSHDQIEAVNFYYITNRGTSGSKAVSAFDEVNDAHRHS